MLLPMNSGQRPVINQLTQISVLENPLSAGLLILRHGTLMNLPSSVARILQQTHGQALDDLLVQNIGDP